MHLVLGCLERDACNHACCLYSFCRSRLAVTGHKSALKNPVERMLHACQTLGGIIILVVDMDIIVLYSLFHLGGEKIVVDERFGGLAREFHHHACRRVGVHVGVLAGDVVVFSLDDFEKHVAGLGPAGNGALVAVGDVAACHILARGVHQFILHAVLDFFDGHPVASSHAYAVGDFLNQGLVLAHLGSEHGFADCCLDLFLVVSDHAAITFLYKLYHVKVYFSVCEILCKFRNNSLSLQRFNVKLSQKFSKTENFCGWYKH